MKLHFKTTLFDSEKDSWLIGESVFHEKIRNKENIIILIENEESIWFGCYIHSRIHTIISEDDEEGIEDSKSFVFTFKNNKPMKFEMKEDKQEEKTIRIFNEDHMNLFVIGNSEIQIGKEGLLGYCNQHEESYYNYHGISKALTNHEGEENQFDIKQILVWEMK